MFQQNDDSWVGGGDVPENPPEDEGAMDLHLRPSPLPPVTTTGWLCSPALLWSFCGALTWTWGSSSHNAHEDGEATRRHKDVSIGWMLQPAGSEDKAKQGGWETRPDVPALCLEPPGSPQESAARELLFTMNPNLSSSSACCRTLCLSTVARPCSVVVAVSTKNILLMVGYSG